MDKDELFVAAKDMMAPYDLLKYVHENGRLPVVNFAAGGVATPADAALMMQLGMDGVFVGSGIFKSGNPEARAKAIVHAVAHFRVRTVRFAGCTFFTVTGGVYVLYCYSGCVRTLITPHKP
jgi:pyridoxal biosynthesis lyase PdxS